jgi:hypothetical protein
MQSKNPEKVPLQQIESADEVELPEANIHTQSASCGCLIINADDWGRDDRTTNRILFPATRTLLSERHGFHGRFRTYTQLHPEGKVNSCVE